MKENSQNICHTSLVISVPADLHQIRNISHIDIVWHFIMMVSWGQYLKDKAGLLCSLLRVWFFFLITNVYVSREIVKFSSPFPFYPPNFFKHCSHPGQCCPLLHTICLPQSLLLPLICTINILYFAKKKCMRIYGGEQWWKVSIFT